VSHTRILVHAVFSTKNREPALSKEIKDIVCEHIQEETRKKSIRLLIINGHLDHLHCLISLGPKQCIADVMQSIKGESAYWFNNKSGLAGSGRLTWQDDYFAISVSESHRERVHAYIQNQEQHHQGMTYYQEIGRMAERFGFNSLPSAEADGNE
jgi:putative transposase